jgi:hypothetical protein
MRVEPFIIAPDTDYLRQNSQLLAQAQRLSEAYQHHQLVEDQHLQAIGTALWKALQLGDALDKVKQAAGQHVLPIIIESSDAAILTLPWETLYHPQYQFLGRSTAFTLSRHNPGLSINLPDRQQEPLRVLLLASLPDDLSEAQRLDVEAEQAAVQEALAARRTTRQHCTGNA